jgi:CDP-diacylglycerol--glycerol-3-phosphate 3-phosphatidyltransferase
MTTAFQSQENQSQSLNRLQRRWLATAVSWYIILGFGYWLLAPVWPDAGRWAAIAGLVMGYGLWVLWDGLSQNHRAGETAVLPTLGWGNGLTLMRGLAISLVAGFLFSPWPGGALAWLPMLLYTTADVADYLDGYLARVTNHATALGARLDMEFDGLGMLVVSLLAVWYGQLPWWYLSLGLARYLFVLGLWWREKRNLPVHEITPSVHRRIFAGFQMGFMSAVLWPIIPPAGATIAGTIFAAATAVSFLRDWLVAVGWIDPQAVRYQQARRQIYRLMTYWLPPLWRLGLVGGTAVILTHLSPIWQPTAWIDLFASWHLPGPGLWAMGWVLVLLTAGTAVALGVMGRLFSLLLVFPIGFDVITRGLTMSNGAALACIIILMLLGTGPLSLWRPEERFMVRRAGE